VDKSLLNGRHENLESDERYAEYVRSDGEYKGAYVVTNCHVIRPAANAQIMLSNGEKAWVTHVILEEEKRDLALLLVSVPSNLSLNGIPIAPNDPRVMTPVYAIGSPEGLAGTASEGRVSAFQEFDGIRWLQTSAPISPGSSGGPLLLADGTLAGVTTLTHKEGQNLNFAIPASAVRTFLAKSDLRPRRVRVGASIHLHEILASIEMRVAIESKQSSDAERKAAEKLSDAWEELGKAPANVGDSVAHYRKIIAFAQEADETLPGELKYLANYVVGKASLRAAMQAEPKDAKDAAGTAESCIRYRANGYATSARDQLLKAIELKPEFPPAYEQLYQYQRLCGNWADALLASNTLVKLMPRCTEPLALRAECYRVLGQPDSAKNDLEAATELSPANGRLHYELAKVLVESGEHDEAIESYEKALACDTPDLRDAIHYQLGLAYRKAGNLEKAVAEFTNANAFGWSADVCESQIAECRSRLGTPTSGAAEANVHSLADQRTVYVTKAGKKYHCDGCEYLSKGRIPMSLAEAVGTYQPCSHCRPPTPETTDPGSVNVAVSQHSASRD
jgi:tetratricopeptide (TPR) repeat protein